MKIILPFILLLITFTHQVVLKAKNQDKFSNQDKESMVNEILSSVFPKDRIPERKLYVKLSQRVQPKLKLNKTPRKNVLAAVKNPNFNSYHPITLAFIGKYDMSVEEQNRRKKQK